MVQSSGRLKMYATGWVTLCRNVSRIEAPRWVTLDQNSNFFRIAKRVPGLYRVTLLRNHWVTLGKNMQPAGAGVVQDTTIVIDQDGYESLAGIKGESE